MLNFSKEDIRRSVQVYLRNHDPKIKKFKDQKIIEKIIGNEAFIHAKTILMYASMKSEVDTDIIMKHALALEKTIALPSIDNGSLLPYRVKTGVSSKAKELEFITAEEIDLVLVPGIAFNLLGHRLGRGGGYYDRFLKTIRSDCDTIGLCYDFQIVKKIPMNALDVPVLQVITESAHFSTKIRRNCTELI